MTVNPDYRRRNGPKTLNVQMQMAKPYRKPPVSRPPAPASYLPLHLMRLVALAKAERRCEVAGEVIHFLDVCQKGLVDGLLVRYTAARHFLLLYSTSAKILTY